MADVHSILVGEYFVALAFSSWAAIKSKEAPWPPTLIKTSIAFGILGITSFGSPELAATIGAGFLLAQLIKVLSKQSPYTGDAPKVLDSDNRRTAQFGLEVRQILAWK